MRIGVIGRTRALCESTRRLHGLGHSISFVYTCRDEQYYEWPSSEFKTMSQEINVPFFNDLKIEERADFLRSTDTDICISVNWLTRLPISFIELFPHGILNAHAGDLPKYRGNACINWAILNGDELACMSIYSMDESLDSGPVYLKEYFHLTADTYIGDFYDWANRVVPLMFCNAITGIEHNTLTAVPQDPAVVVLRTFPRKSEDSRINWKCSAQEIHRLIRASSSPFVGALARTEDGRAVRILRAKLHSPEYQFLAIQGQVCETIGKHPLVACGGTSEMLLVTEAYVDDLPLEESMKILCRSLRSRLK